MVRVSSVDGRYSDRAFVSQVRSVEDGAGSPGERARGEAKGSR